MDITAEVGNRIRFLRRERNLSQEQLAEKSDLHSSYVGQLERGIKNPSIATLFKLTQSLNVNLTDLLVGMEDLDKSNDNYALKSYILIEQESASDQKHIYEIIKQIISLGIDKN